MPGNLEPILPNFRINGVDMPTPSDIHWVLPKVWGINGSGQERLNPYGQVELTWSYIHFDDYTTLRDAYDSITGTAILTLPTFYGDINSSSWQSYGGVIVGMPRPNGGYFGGYLTNVKMTVSKIVPGRATVL